MKKIILQLAVLFLVWSQFGVAALVDSDLPEARGEGYLIQVEADGSLLSDSGRKFENAKAFIAVARELSQRKMYPRLVMAAGEKPSPKGSSTLVESIMGLQKEKIFFSVVLTGTPDAEAKK